MSRLFRNPFCAALLLLSGLFCSSTHAQDWAKAKLDKSPRHGEYVTITETGGRKLQAFVVYPEISAKAPVVVLIHEIFGESDWFKEMADELAGAGYIVIAPDLLSGYGPASAPVMKPMTSLTQPHLATVAFAQAQQPMGGMDHNHMQMGGQMGAGTGAPYIAAMPGGTSAFPDTQAVVRAVTSLPEAGVSADLDAAADYGKKLPAASGKLFVAGFCWGGSKSFLYATTRHDLSAAFVFYGTPPPAAALPGITAPVYGFYAANDARVTSTVAQTVLDMKAAGKAYEPVTYDGAGHGFMRAGEAPDASAPNSAARNEAFRRFVKLLGGVQ